MRSVVNDQSAWKNSGVGDFPVTRAHHGKVYASRVRAAHGQIVSKKYNDGKKKMPTSASKSIRAEEKRPWVGRISFFPGHPWAYPRLAGETDGESLLSRRFTARFAQTISQERLVRRGARIAGYVFETVTTIVRSAMDLSA